MYSNGLQVSLEQSKSSTQLWLSLPNLLHISAQFPEVFFFNDIQSSYSLDWNPISI